MSPAAGAALSASCAAALYAFAIERVRAYGLTLSPFSATSLAAIAFVASFAAWLAAHGVQRWSAPVLVSVIVVCAVTDARTGYVFDRVLWAAAPVAIGAAAIDGRLFEAVEGATASVAIFGLLFLASGRRGIGLGDVKLSPFLGLCPSLPATVRAIGYAFVAGAVCALALLALQRARRGGEMRFAPFLAFGTALTLVQEAW